MTARASGHVRLEDPALLTGRVAYTADLPDAGCLHAALVRSTAAHARIRGIDARAALAAGGVTAVFTAADLDVPAVPFLPFAGQLDPSYSRRPLAAGTVRFVGDPVAVVLADSRRAAIEAAALVVVDLEGLPRVTEPAAAARDEVVLFPETGTNIALHSVVDNSVVDMGVVDSGPGTVRVTTRVVNQRMAVAPMEPNSIIARPGPDGRLTIWLSTQMPHTFGALVANLLGFDPARVRVIAPAVGGGFGGKNPFDADYVLICAVARHTGQAVRWTQTRAENLLTMQGRGHVFDVALEATGDGRITSLDVTAVSDVGAYPGVGVGMIHTSRALAPGPYRIPHVRYEISCVATNTAPTVAFRGAGRPEATHALERGLDELAAVLAVDPAQLRLRNFVPAGAFPHTTVMGTTYDTGDYRGALLRALELVGYEGLRREQRHRRAAADPSLLGVGIGCYVEVSAAPPGFAQEYASVEIEPDGGARVIVGTSSHGQGHRTMYALIVHGVLGIALSQVRLVQSDTALVVSGRGTGGSRSAQIGGSAVRAACDAVRDKALLLASHLLEVPAADLEVAPGAGIAVRGAPTRAVSWGELAAAAADPARRPAGMAAGLSADPGFDQDGGTAPFGSHIAVVEVDRDTGLVMLRRMVAVDDCGIVINPLTATGQVHGGLAASIGQALFEQSTVDDLGRLVHDSFATYQMPAAADLPSFDTDHTVTPTPKNPLGAKGLGEAGAIGALAAVHNAVIDALRPLGVRDLQTPLSPLAVWTAIRAQTGA